MIDGNITIPISPGLSTARDLVNHVSRQLREELRKHFPPLVSGKERRVNLISYSPAQAHYEVKYVARCSDRLQPWHEQV